jgi:hypothetical protein
LFIFFRPLCCLFFCLSAIVLSVLLSFGHCVVCSSSIYGFWLTLWYLQTLLSPQINHILWNVLFVISLKCCAYKNCYRYAILWGNNIVVSASPLTWFIRYI